MPAFKNLVKGNRYQMIVDDIIDNASRFESSRDRVTMYCHTISLRDENGYIYPSQLCTKTENNGICKRGDLIEFEISAYTKEVYSLTKVSRVATDPDRNLIDKIKESGPIRPSFEKIVNPNISGTAVQAAIHEAIYFLCHRPNIPLDNAPEKAEIFQLADEIYAWYESKINVNTQS